MPASIINRGQLADRGPAGRARPLALLSSNPSTSLCWRRHFRNNLLINDAGDSVSRVDSAHELYEIQGIKKAMADAGGFMNARYFHELIREGKRGNLHDLAWDEANRVVEEMRRRKA